MAQLVNAADWKSVPHITCGLGSSPSASAKNQESWQSGNAAVC